MPVKSSSNFCTGLPKIRTLTPLFSRTNTTLSNINNIFVLTTKFTVQNNLLTIHHYLWAVDQWTLDIGHVLQPLPPHACVSGFLSTLLFVLVIPRLSALFFTTLSFTDSCFFKAEIILVSPTKAAMSSFIECTSFFSSLTSLKYLVVNTMLLLVVAAPSLPDRRSFLIALSTAIGSSSSNFLGQWPHLDKSVLSSLRSLTQVSSLEFLFITRNIWLKATDSKTWGGWKDVVFRYCLASVFFPEKRILDLSFSVEIKLDVQKVYTCPDLSVCKLYTKWLS